MDYVFFKSNSKLDHDASAPNFMMDRDASAPNSMLGQDASTLNSKLGHKASTPDSMLGQDTSAPDHTWVRHISGAQLPLGSAYKLIPTTPGFGTQAEPNSPWVQRMS